MKVELRIHDTVLVIESDGAISLQMRDAARPSAAPVPVAVPDIAPVPVLLPSAPPVNDELFHKLVELRRVLASAGGVPPYVIFHDKTLREMVENMPADMAAFGKIGGVGQAKLEKYGAHFLAVLHEGVAG